MKIVFEGDSVTDAGRSAMCARQIPLAFGQSYALLASAHLSAAYPGRFTFENMAVNGSRSVDVYARIKTSVWNKRPDVLSLLIGVNDVWHDAADDPNGVDAVRFERVCDMLIGDSLAQLPQMKILLLEPFVLRGSATEAKWDFFREETKKRGSVLQGLAEKYDQTFLPLQEMFDAAEKIAPASYWLRDGVHPTPAGQALIAERWQETFLHKVL